MALSLFSRLINSSFILTMPFAIVFQVVNEPGPSLLLLRLYKSQSDCKPMTFSRLTNLLLAERYDLLHVLTFT
jgi:hypothetical protein